MTAVSKNDILREQLEAIRASSESGVLEAEDVVESARSADSPLHRFFEWDDAKAAHQHRLSQARRLIRMVTVVTKTETVEITSVAYARDPARERGYLSIAEPREEEVAADIARHELKQIWFRVERLRQLSAALGLQDETALIESSLRTFETMLDRSETAA